MKENTKTNKQKRKKKHGREIAQIVKCLPSKCEDLSSIPRAHIRSGITCWRVGSQGILRAH